MAKSMEELKAAQAKQHAELELIKGAVADLSGRLAPLSGKMTSLQQNVSDLTAQLAQQQNDSQVFEIVGLIQSDVAEAATIVDSVNALLPSAQEVPPPA